MPLLPDRLSYPELIPDDLFETVLYKNDTHFNLKLEEMVTRIDSYLPARRKLSAIMGQYAWEKAIHLYDLSTSPGM
jgi:hypothetical protein